MRRNFLLVPQHQNTCAFPLLPPPTHAIPPPPQKSKDYIYIFFFFSGNIDLDTHLNRLAEAIQMRIHNQFLHGELRKVLCWYFYLDDRQVPVALRQKIFNLVWLAQKKDNLSPEHRPMAQWNLCI